MIQFLIQDIFSEIAKPSAEAFDTAALASLEKRMTMSATTPALGEEYTPEGEAEDIETVLQISLGKLRNAPGELVRRPVQRGQHPKSHGCVRAEFAVGSDVPPELRHGVFREPRTYSALVRFSSGITEDDREGDIHGLAIKLLGVEGPKVLESDKDATTHDFVLSDQSIFFIRDVADYIPFSRQVLRLSRRRVGGKPSKCCSEPSCCAIAAGGSPRE